MVYGYSEKKVADTCKKEGSRGEATAVRGTSTLVVR